MMAAGKNRIMIHGPKDDGTYIIEFRTAEGESLAITIPRTEAAVIKHFQARMPYGLIFRRRHPRDESQYACPIHLEICEIQNRPRGVPRTPSLIMTESPNISAE